MIEAVATRKKGHRLAGVLAGALALGVIPLALPAGAQTDPLPAARVITDFACPADPGPDGDIGTSDDVFNDVPEDNFTDVANTNLHEFAIDCVAWYGVALGTSSSTYTPAGNVKRDQMASFIANLVDYAADPDNAGGNGSGQALPSVPTGNAFPCDLSNTNTHYNNIQRLAAAGIIAGTGSSTAGACYNPSGTVSRAQMATFIKQAAEWIINAPIPPVSEDYFADDDGNTHENNINIVANKRIARGTGTDANNDNVYSPSAQIRRDQMASFLANKLGSLADTAGLDLIEPPPAVDTITITPTPATNSTDISVTVLLKRGNVDSIQVSGCGITGTDLAAQTFLSTNPATAVGLELGTATGNCELTIVIDTDEGTTITETRTITVN